MIDHSCQSDAPTLALTGVQKHYGGVQALADGTLEVRRGEIHALLGENGAGKSTLVKIIAGAVGRDAGTILWGGREVEIRTMADAERLGIHVIHQHLNVLDYLSVAENIALGRERSRLFMVDFAEARRRAVELLARLGVRLDVDAPAENLRIAEKQVIEIARALWGDVRLLIMDEPTASLGPGEVERLFEVVAGLRERGISVVFISHKLDEVMRIADRITVLRDGRTVGTVDAVSSSHDDLIEMMVGRRVGLASRKPSHVTGRTVVEVEALGTDTGLSGVSFQLKAGEVLGVYGLLGSGRTELAMALFGADPVRSGTVKVNGDVVRFRSPADAKAAGLGLVNESRADSVFPELGIRENLTSASADIISTGGWLRRGRERTLAQRMVDALRVRTLSIEAPLRSLSGGNQQKVVVGRWLMREVPILILDDPTSGIDVGAKEELYNLIFQMTANGTAILMTSSELPELLHLADRIMVLHQGRLVGVLAGADRTEFNVVRMAIAGNGDAPAERLSPQNARNDREEVSVDPGL
jgi:ribose transport system ATP-binding protein